LNKGNDFNERSVPLLIRKEEKMVNLNNKKGVDSPKYIRPKPWFTIYSISAIYKNYLMVYKNTFIIFSTLSFQPQLISLI
jgi:hypothetical protein